MKTFIESLKSNTTIPYEVGEAMKERIVVGELKVDITGKALTSEQHAGGDAGLKNPEVWAEIELDGKKRFVALYN